MNTSFYNGVSGTKTHQYGIDIWADNIANIDTIGFKSSTPEFSTIFAQSLGDADITSISNDLGLGSRMSGTNLDLSQGSFQNTDNTFDLAISGEGWFGIQTANNTTAFTRTGSFQKDADGNVVNNEGDYLLGTIGNNITQTQLSQDKLENFGKYYSSGSTSLVDAYTISQLDDIPLDSVDKQQKINLPDYIYYPPVPTQNVSYKANLNPEITKDNNDNEIANSEHFNTSIIAPNGDKDILDMTFKKQVPTPAVGNNWNADVKILKYIEDYKIETYDPTKTYDTSIYNVDTANNQVTKIYDSNIYQIDTNTNEVYKIIDSQTGILTFSSSGELLSNTIPTLSNGGVPLNLNLGTPLSSTSSGFDGLVSNANLKQDRVVQSDGTPDGELKNYGMDDNGNIVAEFSNGKNSAIAKVGVYHFVNDGGLSKMGENLFSETSNSGNPIFYTKSGKNILGSSIKTNSLENSNVNYGTAMTELIILQKAFDANAKSITTSDEMIQNAINMKK